MKKTRVAINGFGRIGRAFLKVAWDRPELEIVAINDLGSIESLTYLLKYDTVYRHWNHEVKNDGKDIWVDGKQVHFVSEKDTTKLPWKDLNIDVVVESTGLFTSFEKAKFHIDDGAKKVVISAPAKGDGTVPGETILLGVNEDKFGTCDITSNASCTTNASSPLIGILNEALGIEKAILNTVHGYTASQALVDGPSKKDLREGRAAAQNIVPSSTGAAIAVTQAYPELKANTNFLELQRELSDTENKIQSARRFYNGNVRDLNTKIERFPGNMVAKIFNFATMDFFDLGDNDAAQNPVEVKF